MNNNILQRAIKAYKDGVFVKKIIKKYEELKYSRYWYKHATINPQKIMFLTFQGQYTCNPKYICNEIIRQNLDWDLVWAVNREDEDRSAFPQNVRTVVFGTEDYFKELYSSRIWIDNAFCAVKTYVKKRPEHIYIETMHGSLGIKKIGPKDVKDKGRNKKGFRCGKLTSYCISNSSFETEVYRTSFWNDTEILEYGHARNDFLLMTDKNKIAANRTKIHKYFNLPNEVNIAMYAPTFREDNSEKVELLDYERLKKSLEQRFGGEWAIVYRTHTRDKGGKKDIARTKGAYCGSDYPDMQELILGVDIGITDYSSWIFDYVLLNKPGFIYAPDLQSYDIERGFYYPISTAPFPVATSNIELESEVVGFDNEQFMVNVKKFLEDKGCIDDGNASWRIVEKMKQIIGV